MDNFSQIIKDYMAHVTDFNDRRIMQESITLIDSESDITDEEINILNEIFMSLKEDYTLKIIQDPTNLDFCIAISKQEIPIIKNKHELNVLVNELKRYSLNSQISKIEKSALIFLEASEHIEENELYIIQNIIRYLNSDWALSSIENTKYLGENIRISRLKPIYSKKLIKKEADGK